MSQNQNSHASPQIAIIGTTASGKSDLALSIARKIGAVILSLDSLCIYRQINIASAKPSEEELREIRHFGVNLIYPNEYFSVGEFIKEYAAARAFAGRSGAPLIITGGSGFYLKAMLSGLAPKVPDFKSEISNDEIYALALRIDPEFAAKLSAADSFRLKKWLSIYKFCGEAPSKFLRENTAPPVISDIKIFEIDAPKQWLAQRIEARTKAMFERGLLEEAEFLFARYGTECRALGCIGLKECGQLLCGQISRAQCEQLVSLHTVQLAKRQRTFNRSQFADKISAPPQELEREILKFLHENRIHNINAV